MRTADLAPLPLINKWRQAGLSPEEIKARSDAWVDQARQSLNLPAVPPPRIYRRPRLKKASGLQPILVIPKRFPPRQVRQPKETKVRDWHPNRKLPDTARLEELFQDHTVPEIAQMFGASPKYVQSCLSESGAIRRKREAHRQARAEEKARNKQDPLTYAARKLPAPEKIAELYKDHSLREIARMFGATAEAVRHHLKKTGEVQKKRAAWEEPLREKVLALWAEGLSRNAIARKLGVSDNFVSRLTEEAGIARGYRKRPIPCPKCESEPYAKGLCKRCYEVVRTESRPLSPEESRAVAERAGVVRKGGPQPGPKPETIERARRVQAMMAEGKSAKEVATALGIHYTAVYHFIKIELDKLGSRDY